MSDKKKKNKINGFGNTSKRRTVQVYAYIKLHMQNYTFKLNFGLYEYTLTINP